MLIIPVLTSSLEKGQMAVMDPGLVDMYLDSQGDAAADSSSSSAATPSGGASASGSGHSMSMRIKLLQMCTVLIKHAPEALKGRRKELTKQGWMYLRRDEQAIKSYAYLNVAYVLASYPSPIGIVLQVSWCACSLPSLLPTSA